MHIDASPAAVEITAAGLLVNTAPKVREKSINKIAMLVASSTSIWRRIGQIGTWLMSTGIYSERALITALRSLCGTFLARPWLRFPEGSRGSQKRLTLGR